jgi:uncharacterized membrane protein YeaQ/YmgE (transglycosylase-associated protein family)
MTPLGALIVFWIIVTVIAGMIGSRKGRTGQGVLLGIVFGLLGVIIISLMRKTEDFLVLEEEERLRAKARALPSAPPENA